MDDIHLISSKNRKATVMKIRSQIRKDVFNILFISIFSSMLGLSIFTPILPIYAHDLGATGLWLGIVISSFGIARVFFMPIIGRLSDVAGRKRIISIGLILYCIISMFYAWSQTVYDLTILRFLHGLASSMIFPIAMAYVGDITSEKHLGDRMGKFNIASFLGMGGGPLIGGFLTDQYGFDLIFYFMVALGIFSLLLVLIMLPNISHNRRQDSIWYKEILKNDIIKGMVIYRAIYHISIAARSTFLPIYSVLIGLSLFQIGIVLAMSTLLSSLLQYPFSSLTDRYNKLNLIVASNTLSTLSLCLIPFTRDFVSLLTLTVMFGISGAINSPATIAITAEAGKDKGLGSVMGIFDSAGNIGMMIGPLILGIVFDFSGLANVFYLGAALQIFAVVILCAFIFNEKARRQSQDARTKTI
jgi:MFS transporter, DHA1 family, multidrug resistance protein